MNDRELLELAAKAGGIEASWLCPEDEIEEYAEYLAQTEGMWLNGSRGSDNSAYWNPLADDGDALRLAVKLHIDSHWSHLRYATAFHIPLHAAPTIRVDEYGSDPYATTRRAIVRAAAEIGRAMP